MSENKCTYAWAAFELFHSTIAQLEEEIARFPPNEETKAVLVNLKTISSIAIKRLRSLCDISFNQADPLQRKEVLEDVSRKILNKTLPEQCCLSTDLRDLFGSSPTKES